MSLGGVMSLVEKFKEGFWSHIGSASASALMVILGWLFYQIAPSLLPAIEASASLRVILATLLLSFALNVALVVIVWCLFRRNGLKLKFGILWDRGKNPHCPACKNGGLRYGEYNWGEIGYYCNSCKDVFHLVDAHGKDIAPAEALLRI